LARPARLSRTLFPRLALALLFAASPAMLRAQDTAKAPAATAPRVNLPTGTRVTRPPPSAPATVTRQPSGAPAATQQPTQQQVTVPDLSGRTVDEARRLLASVGLVAGRVAEGTGSGTPGTIIQQQPQAGSVVAPKSAVRLWLAPRAVATAPPPLSRPPVTQQPPAQQPPVTQPPPATRPPPQPSLVTVPRLAGRTVDDARAVLARVSLQVGDVAEAAGTGAPGTIVRQSPRPGMPVARGSAVRVWVVPARVAQQPRDTPAIPLLVRVPNVVGQTVEGARETLAAAGLAPGAVAEAAGTGAPGTVARQQPAAGSAMLPNSRVGLWLVPARRAVMPAIMGQPLDRARELVRQAGLRPGEVDGTGRVIGHTFQAGTSVPVGSVVNISLGLPPGPVGQVATRPDPPPPVTPQPPEQRPPPARDTAATAIATADSGAVPDVRRLALPQAQAALAAAGFAVAFDTALADSARWIVSAQQPSPGARLASGGVVAVLLDPPAPVAVAPTSSTQPPLSSGLQETQVPPAAQQPGPRGRALWIALAALLLIVAAAAGARRMRARKRLLPVAGVSARLRMDAPARVAVEGAPFGDARLRFRMNPGRTAVRVAAAGPLFVSKEVTGD
jgi:beta-lactam-binding protein with PASTA domain